MAINIFNVFKGLNVLNVNKQMQSGLIARVSRVGPVRSENISCFDIPNEVVYH